MWKGMRKWVEMEKGSQRVKKKTKTKNLKTKISRNQNKHKQEVQETKHTEDETTANYAKSVCEDRERWREQSQKGRTRGDAWEEEEEEDTPDVTLGPELQSWYEPLRVSVDGQH